MALSGLDSALSGLRIAQQQLGVISNNISNVGTEGYTRKILPQSAQNVAGQGVGVSADKIIRKVNTNDIRDFWTQTSGLSALETKAKYLNKIQDYHGDPAQGISVSAELSELRDLFSSLSDSPEDLAQQRSVVNQAQTVASRINGLAQLFTQMRNDAQDEIGVSVNRVNDLLGRVADLNGQIKQSTYLGKTTAALEDLRDTAIKEVAGEIDITTFQRSDGVIVVQTKGGVQLADERAEKLSFNAQVLGDQSHYPDSAAALLVGIDPAHPSTTIDLTKAIGGGKLGALLDLRDTTIPRQQAELDELAQKVAQRFDQQGLRLFTDSSGTIPSDAAPVLTPGAVTSVAYVGFAGRMQVNPAVLADNSLVQKGTADLDVPVQSGSNEVIRRITDFTFGDVAYKEAVGTVDIRANATGSVSLQEWTGLYSSNQVTGTTGLKSYADIDAIIAAGGAEIDPGNGAPLNDAFQLTFSEDRTGAGPSSITIDLETAAANHPIGSPGINDALDQIIAEINGQVTAAGVPASLAATASRNSYGQLVIQSRGDITVSNNIVGGLNDKGMAFLGLKSASYETQDPYLDIQVGNDPAVRVTIEPGDTETDLLAKLEYNPATATGIPGLGVTVSPTGRLTLRPGGDDPGGPVFGGDIKITAGTLKTNGTGGAGIASGSTAVKALFGTDSPIISHTHTETDPFRTSNLGPGADISTGVLSSSSLVDFAQKIVNKHAEEVTAVEAQAKDETSYAQLLQKKITDNTGVNVDEELSNLIVVQTAYAAAARAVTAVDDMFQTLLDAFR